MDVQTILDRLPEEWPTKFLELYDVGASDWELMREFGIAPKEWKLLMNAMGHSQFNEVVEYGNALARAWWERQGRVHLGDKQFNTPLYNINMQNRFEWAQKANQETAVTPIEHADLEDIDRRISELRDGLTDGKPPKVSGDVEA